MEHGTMANNLDLDEIEHHLELLGSLNRHDGSWLIARVRELEAELAKGIIESWKPQYDMLKDRVREDERVVKQLQDSYYTATLKIEKLEAAQRCSAHICGGGPDSTCDGSCMDLAHAAETIKELEAELQAYRKVKDAFDARSEEHTSELQSQS